MARGQKNIFDRAGRLHPLKTMVYFVIAGIAMLFFTLMLLFTFNRPEELLSGRPFPRPFIISTALIFAGSFTVEMAFIAYKKEDSKKLLDYLMLTLGLALGFAVTQAIGWVQLWQSGITLFKVEGSGSPNGAYLFILSGLHLLHLVVGLIFLFLAMFKAVNVRGDDVRSVLYFTDPYERTRVEMLARYWHFLGGLWFALFLFFLWFFV